MMNLRCWLTALVFLMACSNSDHPGYKRSQGSVHYKLLAVGDEELKVEEDKFISLVIKVEDMKGNTLAMKRVNRIQFSEAVIPGAVKQILVKASSGDSLEVIGNVRDLEARDWLMPIELPADTTLIKLNVAVHESLTMAALKQIRAEERILKDAEWKELRNLQLALDSLGFSEDELINGIYFRSLKPGSNVRPTSGSELRVKYKAYLAGGKLVDDTDQGEVLEYIVGKPDQVLPGFSVAVSMMSAGERALFVIPNHLAFGAKGSSSGIVPPYAALVYDAEIIDVKN